MMMFVVGAPPTHGSQVSDNYRMSLSLPGDRGSVVYDGAVIRADLDMWESELESVLARILPLFYRTESKRHAEQYVRGLLSPIQRKNGWTIAEHVGEPEPTALQRFLNLSPWDADALLEVNREYAMEHLAAHGGILVADPTGFRRRGPSRWECSGNTPERWGGLTTVRSPHFSPT
jgi:hypothetical protein